MLALAAADVTSIPELQLLGSSQQQLEAAAPLVLLGLAVMANPLRWDTADHIATLQAADLRCAMVTGDHVRTGEAANAVVDTHQPLQCCCHRNIENTPRLHAGECNPAALQFTSMCIDV